jgi:hypothetical protein
MILPYKLLHANEPLWLLPAQIYTFLKKVSNHKYRSEAWGQASVIRYFLFFPLIKFFLMESDLGLNLYPWFCLYFAKVSFRLNDVLPSKPRNIHTPTLSIPD